MIGHLPPDLAGCLLIGLEKGLAQRGGYHRVLPLGHVCQRVPHPMHAGAVEEPRVMSGLAGFRRERPSWRHNGA